MAEMGANVGSKDFGGEDVTPSDMGFTGGNQPQSGGIDMSEGPEGVGGLTTGAPTMTPAQFNALTPEQKAKLEGVPFERNIFGNPDFKSQTLAINNFISRYQKEKGPLGEAEFNTLKGLTPTNPFGVEGVFTRTLGIDPAKVDYTDILGGGRAGTVYTNKNPLTGEYLVRSGNVTQGIPQGIPAAQYNRMVEYGTPLTQTLRNQYSKYINPENIPGAPGFNAMYPRGTQGTLRSGAEKAGLLTQFGPVMGQYREMSPTELGVRALLGMTPIGFTSMLDTQEYGIPGRKGYEGFDPANPRGAQTVLGNAFEKLKEGVGSYFNQTPSSTGVGIDSGLIPSGLIPSTSPLSGETSAAPQQEFVRDPAIIDALIDGYNRPAQQPMSAGEQLADMNFFERMIFENNLSPEAKEIMRQNNMTIDDLLKENAPEPATESPNILDMIRGVTQTSALGGPATANQVADLSGLFSNGMNVLGDIVPINGGYKDTRTGKKYSGRYNPSATARTYIGTETSSGVAPFSAEALKRGLADIFGG